MKVRKEYQIFSCPEIERVAWCVTVTEWLDCEEYAIVTWTGAVLLCALLARYPERFEGKKVLEIGAGTGLPSLLCGKMKAERVYLSDRADEPDILKLLQENMVLNEVQETCQVLPLNWSEPKETLDSLPPFDVLLGADIFYSSECFEDIMHLVFGCMARNPKLVFYTTYQQRSSHRTIKPHLDRYGMQAKIIPQGEILHSAHSKGFCEVINVNTATSEREVDIRPTATFDDFLILEITLRAHTHTG